MEQQQDFIKSVKLSNSEKAILRAFITSKFTLKNAASVLNKHQSIAVLTDMTLCNARNNGKCNSITKDAIFTGISVINSMPSNQQ